MRTFFKHLIPFLIHPYNYITSENINKKGHGQLIKNCDIKNNIKYKIIYL